MTNVTSIVLIFYASLAIHILLSQPVSRTPYGQRINRASDRSTREQPASNEQSDVRHNRSITKQAPICDFLGQTLKVAVSPQAPFVDCNQDTFGDWICNGSNIEVIRVLERQINFKTSWIVLTNNHYDDTSEILQQKNQLMQERRGKSRRLKANSGSSDGPSIETARSNQQQQQQSGIFGLVGSGRVLLSANGVMQTLDRSDFNLTVSEPFDSFKMHFLLSKSVRDHDHIFLKPFALNAWIAILASATLVVPIFYVINTTSCHYNTQDDTHLKSLGVRAYLAYARHQAKQMISNAMSSCKRKRSSSSSLDEEISQMVVERSHDENVLFSKNLLFAMQTTPIKGESRRRRRLIRRQWALERRQARRRGRRRRLRQRSGFFNFAYIIWYVVASLANQGGETEDLPDASSTRILIAFWWLYLIVICAIHSGILTAILTFPKQNDFIQSLDDYLNLEPNERASLHLSVDKYSELAHLLSNSDNLHKSPLQQLTTGLSSRHEDYHSGKMVGLFSWLFGSADDDDRPIDISYINFQRHRQRILDDVQQGHAAFMDEKSAITNIISQEYFDSKQTKCAFKASRYPIDVIPMSLILSKQMPEQCVRKINRTLRRIYKTGLAQKWRRKFESPGNDCLNAVVINAGDVDKIEFKHVLLAHWLLSIGIIIGVVSLAIEIAWLFLVQDEHEDDDDHVNTNANFDDTDTSLSSSSSSSSMSSSSSSSSSYSSDSDKVQLSFRKPLVMLPNNSDKDASYSGGQQDHHSYTWMRRNKAIRSLQAKRTQLKNVIRRTRRNQKRLKNKLPKIVLSIDHQESSNEPAIEAAVGNEDVIKLSAELKARRSEERRRRKELKAVERRTKRVQKSMDFLKKLHNGQIYTNAIKSRMRRMSTAIVNHLSHEPDSQRNVMEHTTYNSSDVSVRRRHPMKLRIGNGRVAPNNHV